jgi:hypothetical protein
VPLPDPQPGLVIRYAYLRRYAYLWLSQEARGRQEGAKDRPFFIAAAAWTRWRLAVGRSVEPASDVRDGALHAGDQGHLIL